VLLPRRVAAEPFWPDALGVKAGRRLLADGVVAFASSHAEQRLAALAAGRELVEPQLPAIDCPTNRPARNNSATSRSSYAVHRTENAGGRSIDWAILLTIVISLACRRNDFGVRRPACSPGVFT
jgi:hypothetical protein